MESISVGLDGFSITWYYCMVLLHGISLNGCLWNGFCVVWSAFASVITVNDYNTVKTCTSCKIPYLNINKDILVNAKKTSLSTQICRYLGYYISLSSFRPQ